MKPIISALQIARVFSYIGLCFGYIESKLISLRFQAKFGQRERISEIDAEQMNLLYKTQCEEGAGGGGGGGDGGE